MVNCKQPRVFENLHFPHIVATEATEAEAKEIGAAFVSREDIEPKRISEALERLPVDARPSWVLQLETMPLTDGFRPRRRDLPRQPTGRRIHRLDRATGDYALG